MTGQKWTDSTFDEYQKQKNNARFISPKAFETVTVRMIDPYFVIVNPGDDGLDGRKWLTEWKGREITTPQWQARARDLADNTDGVLKLNKSMIGILSAEVKRNNIPLDELEGITFRIERYAMNAGGRVDILRSGNAPTQSAGVATPAAAAAVTVTAPNDEADEDDIIDAIETVKKSKPDLTGDALANWVKTKLKNDGKKATLKEIKKVITDLEE